MKSSYVLVLTLCFVAVSSQRFPNFNVNRGANNLADQECFCLPPNQRCDPTQDVPFNSLRIQMDQVNTRILNTNPEALCRENRIPCCFNVPPGSGGNGGIPPTGRHPPSQSSCGLQFSLERRSVAGQADFGEYPWTALITNARSDFVSTAALVSNLYLITAAHRIPEQWRSLIVRLGDYDISNEFDRAEYAVESIPIADIIIHPGFNRSNLINDIALIQLARPVQFSRSILPVCLPEKGQRFVGQKCFVSGWGQNIQGNFQQILKEVDLPIVDSYECEDSLRKTELSKFFVLNKNSFMCAGGEIGKDSCEGDGGAPLVCKEPGRELFVAVGLVAWGRSCGTSVPGVYVNVEYFANWINSFINQGF